MKNQANLTASTFPEITFRGIILGVILAIVLAASNTFLALKIGFVTSASIPASIFAMGILRFFKKNNVLENNMVQTLKNLGSEFLDYSIYKKHTKLFDMLSANEEDKNIRLVPEFYKHQWGTLDPLEFIPDERAQKMLMAIIHHIYSNKESLAKMIQN